MYSNYRMASLVNAVGPHAHNKIDLSSPGMGMESSNNSCLILPVGPVHSEEGEERMYFTDNLQRTRISENADLTKSLKLIQMTKFN